MSAEVSKAVMRRWYDEMWSKKNTDLIPELAGPDYVRHEPGGTRSLTAEEYRDQTAKLAADWTISDMRYSLIAEGDKVVAIGSWKLNGQQMDWVQCFRVEKGKLVETWLSGVAQSWDDAVYANLETTIIPG
ncbi:MAG: nuclear transport factor 2 family protein [Deltaproteobacteria bacterium]|nr:nuclear transport factor 2 family protein [Deltaproteobacteria bacterium]MBW2361883.1 nuclear transport factor 2 family protein [Deltaproteobacteria bacterium]